MINDDYAEVFWSSAIGTKPDERQKAWAANRDMFAGNPSKTAKPILITKTSPTVRRLRHENRTP
jgi:hypothetical protein